MPRSCMYICDWCVIIVVAGKNNTHWAFVHLYHKPAAAEQLNGGLISRIKPDK